MKLLKVAAIALKIAQLLSLLGATATVGRAYKQANDGEESDDLPAKADLGHSGRMEFFLFATSIGMVIVIVVFTLHITGLEKRYDILLSMITTYGMWILILLVSSALLAKTLATMDKEFKGYGSRSICEKWDEDDGNHPCRLLVAGVILGFVSMVLFALDAMFCVFTFLSTSGFKKMGSRSSAALSNDQVKPFPAADQA